VIKHRNGAILVWAVRDALRRPGESLLLAAVLALFVTVTATVLILTGSISHTASLILESAPSLVVRRISSGGWAPVPVATALSRVASVPGVMAVRSRIWGLAAAGGRPVTVIGIEQDGSGGEGLGSVERYPGPGEAVVGPGVESTGGRLVIDSGGGEEMKVRVVGTFSTSTGIFTHDIVALSPGDARRILRIPPGAASDLAIDVFHEEEASAILPDLVAAFPWPVRITTRRDMGRLYTGNLTRRGGISMMLMVPALLALVLIAAGTVRERMGRRYEIGLLKSLGWLTGDIVRLQVYRALFIGLPATAFGILIAGGLVFWPGASWPAKLFLGWGDRPVLLYLHPAGAVPVFLEIAAVTLAPFIGAVLWPTLRGATADPEDLLRQETS
jgi:hypothetical protein